MKSIILSRRNFREFDQIISLYTLERGKLEVLARGIKKITSKNSPALEPGCLVEAEIINGKELNHLGSVQLLESYKNIRINLEKSLATKFILGLFDKVVQEREPDKDLFLLLDSRLSFLANTNVIASNHEAVSLFIDIFVAKFLKILGFSNGNVLEDLKFQNFKNQRFDKKLHDELCQSLVYNLDIKVNDWAYLI